MTLPPRDCPYCSKLMWVKDESIEWVDDNTIRFHCPHCQTLVRRTLVQVGANATGPIKPS